MQALQPEGIQVNRAEDQLTTEEINNLLIHAHKRVIQLQKQIEKIQVLINLMNLISFFFKEEMFDFRLNKVNKFKLL
jgi:hypothetical protein